MHLIGFLLVRLAPMYVVLLAVEALRLANKYAGRRVFDWMLISEDGKPIEASNGIAIDCDSGLAEGLDLSHLFVIAGDDPTRDLTPKLRKWLIRTARSRSQLGAIDSGLFLLAECRLVQNRAVTLHPAAAAAFREQFPEIEIRAGAVVLDRSLLTCAGGLATVDLMRLLISEHCGEKIALSVADDMVWAPAAFRDAIKPGRHVEVDEIASFMQQSIETPLSLQELAQRSGISARQMTRLFQRSFNETPMAYYRRLRLDHARQLLFQSELSITEIAAASGFRSLSSFSRRFSARFGRSPSELLATLRRDGHSDIVPASNRIKKMRLRAR